MVWGTTDHLDKDCLAVYSTAIQRWHQPAAEPGRSSHPLNAGHQLGRAGFRLSKSKEDAKEESRPGLHCREWPTLRGPGWQPTDASKLGKKCKPFESCSGKTILIKTQMTSNVAFFLLGGQTQHRSLPVGRGNRGVFFSRAPARIRKF